MSDILASVSVVLGAEISGFRAAMADARKELKGLIQFSEGLKDIGSSLTTYVSAPLAVLGAAAVAASAKMESLGKGLQAISQADLGKQGVTGLTAVQIAAQRTGERLQELQVLAKAPGIGFEQAVQGDIRLRSVGISAEQSAKSLKEFANAIATTGGGASEFDRVTTQLAQLSAKGKVLSQDLRPIIEAAPAVSQALLKLYGTIDSESISASLAKQGKSSQDFIAILTDELAKLPRVTGGLANAFENLRQTAVQSAAKLGDGISRALNLPALVESVSNGIERIGNAFAGFSPGVQKAVVVFGALVAATGPVLVAVGTLGAALPAITAGFATLGVGSLAALAPILPVAAAVAAAALLIYENWDSITQYFSSGEGSQLFSGLATAAQSAASAIGEAFSTLSANVGGNFGEMVSAATIFRTLFRELAVGVTSALNVLAGAISTINGLLTGDFTQAADGAKQAFFGLVDPIANLLGFTVKQTAATQGLIEKFDALAVVTPGLANLLNNLSSATPFAVVDIASTSRQVGLLEELKAKLKDVQDQRDKETTVGAIKVDNAEIISLQKQIAALEGTGKKAQSALQKLQQELANNDNLSRALGASYDYVGERTKILQSGLKSLVSAGFSPLGSTVQGIKQQFDSLAVAVDQLGPRVAKGLEKINEVPEFKLQLPDLDLAASHDPVLPDYKAIFSSAAQNVLTGTGLFQNAAATFTQAQADFNTNTEKLIDDFPAQAFDNLGAGLGEALGNGSDVLASVGQALLKTLAGFLAEYGHFVILKGAADIALGNVGQGIAELVAGGALTALGGFAVAAGSGSRATSGGGGISSSAASTPRSYTPTAAPDAAKAESATYIHKIEVTASGRNLAGVLEFETDRFGRVMGKG